jgi:hypothetical protein
MPAADQLAAVEAIRQAKAAYIRGVDEGDAALVRAILHPNCELDYRGCFVDPASGHDFFPAMGIVRTGRDSFGSALVDLGIVSVHQIYNPEIVLSGETTATAVFPMTDRLWFPAGGEWPYAQLTGYGHYRETWELLGGAWLLRTTRVTRLRVEGQQAP